MNTPPVFFTHYLIVYDIADSKRCVLVNRALRQYCWQQQRSVFEGELTNAQLHALHVKIKSIMDFRKDSVIIYPLTKTSIFAKKALGLLPYRIMHII